jgi:cell division septation protein DedD
MTDVMTMNLSDAGDSGMVSLNNNQSSNFVQQPPDNIQFQDNPQNIASEKNMSENKQTMDSTPISDIMGQPEQPLEPPMMAVDPRMVQAQAQAPMMALQQQPQTSTHTEKEKKTSSKNPFDLTDDQMQALLVAACTAVAISKPVQEKLATTVPRFLNDSGARTMVGLGSTGLVAAVVFYFVRRYI